MFLSYEAPVVEVIEVEVEKGFALSGEEGNAPITFNQYPHSDEYIPAVRECINYAIKSAIKE